MNIRKTELTEMATSVCLLQKKTETANRNEKQKFVFLGRQLINGNRRAADVPIYDSSVVS
jgi:hypothetical protein